MLESRQGWRGREEYPPRILIVEDDPGIRQVLEEALQDRGYQVRGVPDGLWVSRALREGSFPFDLVILDWKMPGLDGLAVLRELKTFTPETPAILISLFSDDALWVEALSLGVFEVLSKPLDFGELFFTVERALQQGRGREASGGEGR